MFGDSIITKFSPDSNSIIPLKIDQYLMKLRHKKKCAIFDHPVVSESIIVRVSCHL